ncbi:hypothetical protein ILUMI_05113 [Ignelater luminosus]|uniref:c-Myc-binding protein n=1 Tax=Ignelater luminosus TaxID=2038154 RepID=A0A8K0DDI0_IGNLU|nr:hypothetical protein ILUMI_05113 [Ignelater luminosus]
MSANPNYKPSEGKREEFRKYLEKTGVMDALTKVLVSLYEEPDKPENAIEYICNKLTNQICGETLDSIKSHLDEARTKIAELETEIATLKGAEGSTAGSEAPPAESGEQVSQSEETAE